MTGREPTPRCPHSELAVGWALHALEPADEILVAAHLPDCAECTRTVAETEQIGAVLGLSVPQAVPSAELEQRVLAVVHTAQDMSVTPPAPRPVPANGPWTTAPSPGPSRSAPPWRSRRKPSPQRRPRRKPWCVPDMLKLLAVALLVLAVAVAIVFAVFP